MNENESERLWRVALGNAGREWLKRPEIAPFAEDHERARAEHMRRYSASSGDAVEGALARLVGAVAHEADIAATARETVARHRERRAGQQGAGTQ